MRNKSHLPSLERNAVSKIHQLLKQPGLLRASFVYMRRQCGRDYCKCMRSSKHWHGSWYITQSHKGKKRMRHVGFEQEAVVRQWVDRYHEIKRLLNRVADLYWDRISVKKKSR